jgi:hypothetical protein
MPPPGDCCKSFGRQLGIKLVAQFGSNALGVWEHCQKVMGQCAGGPSYTSLGNVAVCCKLCCHQETTASNLAANLALHLLLGMVGMHLA